jgi:hypothetical protein
MLCYFAVLAEPQPALSMVEARAPTRAADVEATPTCRPKVHVELPRRTTQKQQQQQ